MRLIGVLAVVIAAFMVWVACDGGDSADDQTPSPTSELSDEDAILAVMDEFAAAFAGDDWDEVYDLASPDAQTGCSKDLFAATARQADDLVRLFLGDDFWSAYKSAAAGGFVIAGVAVQMNSATVASNDFDAPLDLVQSDGVWRLDPDNFCDALFGPLS